MIFSNYNFTIMIFLRILIVIALHMILKYLYDVQKNVLLIIALYTILKILMRNFK
jgi:hypothetical protein